MYGTRVAIAIARYCLTALVFCIQLPFALVSLSTGYMVLHGLITGKFVREDMMGGEGEIVIDRATSPDWFWDNIQFWGSISVVTGCFSGALLLIVVLLVKGIRASDRAYR